MKLKHIYIVLALAALLAAPGFSSKDAWGRGGGGFHGGGGFRGGGFHGGGFHGGGFHGGGFRGGGFHGGGVRRGGVRGGGFARRGMGARSFSHRSFRNRGFSGRRSGSGRINRSYSSAHRGYRYNRLSGASRHNLGVNRNRALHNQLSGNRQSRTNLRHLSSNRQFQKATLTRQNLWNHTRLGGRDWNRHHWDGDHGWDRHHWWRDRYGYWYGYRWYGPVFWPYYFGDYFCYGFWPGYCSNVYWGYGPDAILWGAFWPYGEFRDGALAYEGTYDGDIYRPYRRRVTKARPGKDAEAQQSQANAFAETCAGFAPGVSDLPIQNLESIIDATEEQRAALADLKAAAAQAAEILKRACPSEAPLTPVARLEAMERRLQAMGEANEAVKEPFIRLYALLTDEQKRRLEAISKPAPRRKGAPASDLNIAELCTSQAGFTAVPADQIASTITLDSTQQQALDRLRAASAEASDKLKNSCPVSVADRLESRLEAAQQRVTALIEAIEIVKPAVRDFYASLTDEQKAALSIQPAGGSNG